jgi:hypothetical protein
MGQPWECQTEHDKNVVKVKKPASGRSQEGLQPKVWTQDEREMEAMAEAIGARIRQSIHMNGSTLGRDDLHDIIVNAMEQEASATRSQGGSKGPLAAPLNWKQVSRDPSRAPSRAPSTRSRRDTPQAPLEASRHQKPKVKAEETSSPVMDKVNKTLLCPKQEDETSTQARARHRAYARAMNPPQAGPPDTTATSAPTKPKESEKDAAARKAEEWKGRKIVNNWRDKDIAEYRTSRLKHQPDTEAGDNPGEDGKAGPSGHGNAGEPGSSPGGGHPSGNGGGGPLPGSGGGLGNSNGGGPLRSNGGGAQGANGGGFQMPTGGGPPPPPPPGPSGDDSDGYDLDKESTNTETESSDKESLYYGGMMHHCTSRKKKKDKGRQTAPPTPGPRHSTPQGAQQPQAVVQNIVPPVAGWEGNGTMRTEFLPRSLPPTIQRSSESRARRARSQTGDLHLYQGIVKP